jgi:phenylglyoxylate dehydrogenase epsilon subunit
MQATCVRGLRVEYVDTGKREIGYSSREREAYDSLLIATGSEPALPAIPGIATGQTLQLRTLDDAKKVMAVMKGSKTAIILGAGMIGMHVAECLAEHGIRVQVVEMLSHVLPSYFDVDASQIIRSVLEGHGVTFFTGSSATEVSWRKGSVSVSLDGGEKLLGDLLMVATGVKARISFLQGSDITKNSGVVVDREMRTNIENVFAAGDVAAAPNFLSGENGPNPILPSAAEQGKIAGSNMAGQKKEYEGWLPMNTFSFFGHRAVSVGRAIPAQGDEVVVEHDKERGAYRKIVYRNDRLLGASFVDTDVDAGVFNYVIRKRVEIGSHKESLLRRPRETSLWLAHEAEKRETVSIEE